MVGTSAAAQMQYVVFRWLESLPATFFLVHYIEATLTSRLHIADLSLKHQNVYGVDCVRCKIDRVAKLSVGWQLDYNHTHIISLHCRGCHSISMSWTTCADSD